jgi:hypothetical protein
MATDRRGIVTNDIADFQPIHDRMLATGEEHAGMIFTFDPTLPRNKAAIPRWVTALDELLSAHRGEHALRNRVHHLL